MAEKLSILNPHPRRLPGPSLLHHLVATNGNPHAIAIDYQSTDGINQQVTYEDLHRRSDLLSAQLRSVWDQSGPAADAKFIVPLFIAQSPDLYVAQLATLKAGAAFCPISLDVPDERLRFIVKDVDASILLTTSSLRESLPGLDGVTILPADDDLQEQKTETTELTIDPSSPAYVMYTSGSTGQPKGVVLSHSAATQALLAHDRHIPKFSRFLQFASPTFDVSVFEIFFPFFRQSTLVCGERRQLLSDLPGFINRANIDACELTPSVASSLLQGRSSVPGLRTLLTIGEMLKHDVVEDFGGSRDDDSVLHGMYGPTEATIHCTLQPSFHKDMSVGNIGIPLDTVSAFIVKPLEADGDPEAQPVILNIGEEGELAVGGHQLADGYLNRPEQTRAAFVQHSEYGLLYRTGDRAKLTEAGRLECLGRISSGQVKLRGQRIELGEIEHAASKTPGCQSVVAEVASGTLVVFLIGDSKQLSPSNILETCRKWLPAFMVPGDTMVLESLPYLPSGKTDRKALHSIYSERIAKIDAADEDASDRLRTILDVLQSGLNAPIRPSTQLAAVGLDSLSAIRIASQLRKAGVSGLDATALLDAQTPREVEHAFSRAEDDGDLASGTDHEDTRSKLHQAGSAHETINAHMNEIEDVFAPTSVQSAMLAETARNSKAYCNWAELSVPNGTTVDRIEACLTELTRRHPLLRSGFLPLIDSPFTHAAITWKAVLQSQIQAVDHFNYHFAIEDEEDLLRPCSFQILHSEAGTRVLVLIHHALYDQWSMDVLRSDLASLLRGESTEVSPSFSHISAYHQSATSNTRTESSLDFWQDQLREFSPTLLPLMTGKRSPFALKRTIWQPLSHDIGKIRSSAQTIGCSAPAIFQAAVAYLLGSYVGSTDVTYGTVFSGRHLPIQDIERIFGPCLSTMPVRLDYGATRTVQDLLRLVHDRNRAVQKHSLLPLSKIRSAAGLTADTKLFDVLFVWQESSVTQQADDAAVKEVDSADQYEFNLVIEFEPASVGLRARATYQQSLITEKQVSMLLRQVDVLAEAMLQSSEMLVEDLSQTLPDSALSIWNASPSPCAPGHDLIRAIEHHASESPRSPALKFARRFDDHDDSLQTVSYEELNSRANQMAHYLVSLKSSPSELVCICMEKSVELYVAILATLKAGCGYLPLLPDTPSARVTSVVRQSGVNLCICDDSSREMMSNVGVVKAINTTRTDLRSFPTNNLPSTNPGSDIAYTVFTSGSTGEPKGVAVTVDNLLGNLEALAELYQVHSGDKLLQACSQAFDVSVFEIFFAFYSGICLCSATKDVLFDDLEASIRSFGVTHLSLTPTVAALIDPTNVPSVRFLVTAGEAVTELVHERWASRGLHQGYGPSETTNICTINMNVQPDDVLGNIGPPFRNTSAMVLAPGSGFNVLPAGAVGEFAFGGEQVFRGYVGMDDLNAEKIFDHPQFGRVYKSGDIGRILHDGTLLISGRLDDQVKVRGNRIELGEINAALLRSSLVLDCSTVVVGESAVEQDLVSFAVLSDARDRSADALQVVTPDNGLVERLFTQLEDSLPSYMVPSMIVTIDRLPLTSQGKLDRRSLKQLLTELDSEKKAHFSRSAGLPSDDEEWSDIERTIASTLANGLSIPPSSISRNGAFFGLGLNSLNAISFSKHLGKALVTPVNPGTVLRNASVSRLARSLESQPVQNPTHDDSLASNNLLPDEVVSEVKKQLEHLDGRIESVLPCTPLQEAMVSASVAAGSSYCNTTWLEISGDVEKLNQCWQRMVDRHEILRTRFINTQSPSFPVVQVATSDRELPFEQLQTGSTDGEASEDPKVNPSRPFQIEWHTSSGQTRLALHMHHAIYDGISMARLLHEVELEYRKEDLPPPVAFSGFLRQVKDQNTPEAMKFWSNRLVGLQPSPFPQPSSKTSIDENVVRTTAGIKSAQVDGFCKRHGVTPLSVFQAALVKLLAHVQRITDVCIGNVVSGRSVPINGIERLVAPCFNTIPVRANLGRMRANLDLIKDLAQGNVQSVDHQLSPLRRLQGLSADPSKRLFDALLLLQPSETKLDSRIWQLEKDTGPMGLPLVLEITPLAEDFTLSLHHLEAVISETVAKDLSQAFLGAVKTCLEYPNSDLSNFSGASSTAIGGVLAPETQPKAVNGHPDFDEVDVSDDWNEEEVLVRDILARFADVSPRRITRNTSMYQLGLDSLNAPQIASQLRSRGHLVDAADVMEALTPRLVARAIQSKERDDAGETSFDFEEFDRRHRDKIVQDLQMQSNVVLKVRPCTSVQNGMIAQSLHSRGDLYINHVTYELPAHVDAERLRVAWKAVMNKHEMLRAGFFNLHDPEAPFAAVIRRSEMAEVPVVIAEGDSSLAVIERQAKSAIVDDIAVSPWRVTLSSNDRYTMTVSIHHALYDAESLQIILSDLWRSLENLPIGDSLNVDALLASTIVSERQAVGSSAAEEFWTTQMERAGFIKFPDLTPTIVPETHLGVELSDCDLSISDIENFCREKGATIQALGQTVWALLLSAYAGETAITFGTVFSGRSDSPSWQTAFPSVVTVPVPCNTEQSPIKVLEAMVTYNAAMQRYRATPLADIQRFAGSPGRSLFDTVFVYQKTSPTQETFRWPVVRETAAVDYAASLELEVDNRDRLQIRLTFDTARIPQTQARIMVQQYDMLLGDIVAGRRSDHKSAPLLYSALAPKVAAIPSDVELLHQFVERSARQYPDRKALEFVTSFDDDTPIISSWTYSELDAISNQIAHAILTAGGRTGSVVALSMEKCPEATFAFVAILKTGCSFLALDPDLPQDRVTFILEDSNSSILLTSGSKAGPSTPNGLPVLNVDLNGVDEFPRTRPNLTKLIDPADTCYVLYTSGTTGAPKGCEITHENAVQAMLSFQRLFSGHWTHRSRWLQFASYWFDVSVLEQFWSWSVGISVVGAPRDIVLGDIPGLIRAMNITHIDLTPSLARLVHPDEVPSLWGGVFITGGEALKQEIIDAWGSKHTICNGYGPTEATIGVTMNTFIGPNAKPSNIGPAFDNVGAYVLNPDSGHPVIRGGVGELCVSGKLVGKGYLNRPDLTAKQFPLVSELGERIYRTGDLVRLLSDDSVQFMGRKDSQAKLRGQRLEIAEIDAVIRGSTEEISDVVSLVVKNEHGREALVSFITSAQHADAREIQLDTSASAREIVREARSGCEKKLPGYMIPTHILPLSLLPLTVNNKVDAKRLINFFERLETKSLQSFKQANGDARPLNNSEREICKALARMFPIQTEQTHSSSNLFSLGLSSISAISFASVLKQSGFERANVATIMKNQTVGELAAALSESAAADEHHQEGVEQAKLAIKAHAQRYRSAAARALQVRLDNIEAVTPCTPLQQGLILESLRDESRPYFNWFTYQLHEVDLHKLQKACHILLSQVQVLRSSFIGLDGGHSQVIYKSQHAPVSRWTISSKSADDAMLARRQEWIRSNSADLVAPLEVHIMESPSSSFLIVHIHHALYDGISYELVIDQLWKIYSFDASPTSGPSFIDALPFGPLRQVSGSEDFWKERLHTLRFAPLPVKNANDVSNPTVHRRLLNSAELEQKRQELGVSHQAIAQAAFELALRQYSGTKSTQIYGIVVSGRSVELEGADKVLGPMFNTLPQPVVVDSASTLREHICRCQSMNAETLPHQHTPLRDIRKWIGAHPGSPLFETLFVFQHVPKESGSSFSNSFAVTSSQPQAEYPLVCEVELGAEGQLDISLLAKGKHFDQKDLQQLMSSLEDVLMSLLSNGQQTLEERFGIENVAGATAESVTNGITAELNGVEHFEWSREAVTIREVVAQIAGLDTEDVDEHTSVFSVGLDSIDAVKLASRLKGAGLLLPVSEILRAQTIPRMLRRLQKPNNLTNGHEVSHLTALEQRLERALARSLESVTTVERILPATPNQEALIADMLRSDFGEYFNHDILRLDDDISVQTLKAAWQTVIDASPILRTSFVQVTDPKLRVVFAQVVHSAAPIDIREIRVGSEEGIGSHLDTVRRDVSATLEMRPPLRLTLASTGSERYLILSIAHALYDGHSLALLHEDVQRAYAGDFETRPSYNDAVSASLTAVEEESRQFWSDTMSGARMQAFPKSRKAAEDNNVYRAEVKSQLSANPARSFCQRQGVSMQALAQTCWALTLAHCMQTLEVLFGVVLACRDSEEAENIMFPMMNTVVMRSALHGTRSEMLRYMQSAMAEMLPYQRTPLRMIQKACNDVVGHASPDLGAALFDTLFIYQHRPNSGKDESQTLYKSVGGSSSVEYPVAVEMEVVNDTMTVRAACKGEVLDQKGTDELVRIVDLVLQRIVAEPDRSTVDLRDAQASICGLGTFSLQSHQPHGTENGQRHPAEAPTHVAPSHTTRVILQAFAEVSDTPLADLDASSTIESIGIDSISAIKVASLLRKKDIKLSVSDIIRSKSAGRMAELVSKQFSQPKTTAAASEDVVRRALEPFDVKSLAKSADIEFKDVETCLPATAGQIYMLSMWKKTHGQIFKPTFRYHLQANVEEEAIWNAWEALVDRHPILRTAFAMTGDQDIPFVQLVLKHGSRTDLARQQPLTSLDIRPRKDFFELGLHIHHALYDAVSLPLVMDDLEHLLAGKPLADPKTEQKDLLALSVSPDARSRQKSFWTSYLRDITPIRLPQPAIDGPQSKVEIFKPGLFAQTSRLAAVARKQGLSIQAVLFAAYAKVYTSYPAKTGSVATDVVLGTYLSNRSHLPELESLAAPTLNLVPLLVRSPKQRSLVEIASGIQKDLQDIGSPENSATGQWEIAEWTGVKVDTFVNFLKLPESSDSGSASRDVRIEEVSDRRTKERREVVDFDRSSKFEAPAGLRGLGVVDAYQHSVDVEMMVTDGNLDVGLFAPLDMIGLEEADEAIYYLKTLLDGLLAEVSV